MRNPNTYGSVIKLKGKRRKPYAVRTSAVEEFIEVSAPKDIEIGILNKFKQLNFHWRRKSQTWSAAATDKTRKYAETLHNKYGYETAVAFHQRFTYQAYFEKASEAHVFLAEFNSGAVIKEQKNLVDSPTFENIYNKWITYKKGLKKQLSESAWRNYNLGFGYLAPIHQMKINSIKAGDIQSLLNKSNSKSASTINAIRTVINGTYKYAKMNKYITEDMTEFLIYEWTDREENIHKMFTKEEIQVLWDMKDEIPDIDIILIYIYTGLRPSELLDIPTNNVYLSEHYMIGGGKTAAGKDRIIPIADKIYPLVKDRMGGEYLVPNKRGRHCERNNFYISRFRPLMNKLGFSHIPHDTRHTFASLMDSAGANIVCTKLIMGHALNDITKGVYTHKSVEELLAEVNKI